MMSTSIQEKEDNHQDRNDEIDAPLFIPKSHRKVFDKIWNEVETIVGAFRKHLYEKLLDNSTPVEKQERLIK